jgi:hypothetical protein
MARHPTDPLLGICSGPAHTGPRALPLGWFPRQGSGRRSSWCRVCLRAPRAEHAARRRGAGVSRVSRADINRLLQAQGSVCPGWSGRVVCGASLLAGFQIDHRWPVSRGGAHTLSNLQLLCARCNREKSDKVPRAGGNGSWTHGDESRKAGNEIALPPRFTCE